MTSVLSIHNGHDGAYTYIKDGEIIFHCNLERYSKIKSFASTSIELLKLIKEPLDTVIFTVHNYNFIKTHMDCLKSLGLIKQKKTSIINYEYNNHHLFHMLSARHFFNSEDPCFVMDGGGTQNEVETLYRGNNVIHKHYTDSNYIGVGPAYSQVSYTLFDSEISEGKTMALSSYGKFNKQLYKKIRYKNDFSKNYFRCLHMQNLENLQFLTSEKDNNFAQNFVKNFQIFCERKIYQVLRKYDVENVITTGGVASNILINTFLKDKLKKVQAHPFNKDDGLSIGSAILHLKGKVNRIKNIYLGPPIELNLDTFNKYKIVSTSKEEVCSLLKNNVVGIFQSRSEQGQRGLGNRSLLIDASNPNAFEMINQIKKREWFRPFACTILEEDAPEWFNCKSSKHMMFVYKINERYKNLVKSILCVNGFSRIQTVSFSDNKHYYDLIKTFKSMYKIPLLLNTSLNLPGHTLVETLDDLKFMFEKTSLKYIYLPEINKLICK